MRKEHPDHPGIIIQMELLDRLGKTAYWLSKGLGIAQITMSGILKGSRAITPGTALRLEKFLGTPAAFWLALQGEYDLSRERRAMRDDLGEVGQAYPGAREEAAAMVARLSGQGRDDAQ